ncbi:MAG: response regulator [Opitutaceae bacterium]
MSESIPSNPIDLQGNEDIPVLIVDDNSVDRQMIVFACMKLNVKSEMASTADQAIELFKSRRHRLVITDYLMEPINGLELAKKLREIDPNVEIIFVSGAPTSAVVQYVQTHDLAPIVSKPITPSALINSATICLERNRGRREVLSDVALTNRMDNCLALQGPSESCERLRREIAKLIQAPDPVLITGPIACGKLQIADFVYRQGVYGEGERLDCRCSEMSPLELADALVNVEGELGKMVADSKNRTLIIHNIESMPMELQHAFAEVYDQVTANTHLILLSDLSLDELLDEALIDDSLYFKLSLWTFHVPPLMERKEDLPELIKFICRQPEAYNLKPEAANAEIERVMEVIGEKSLKKNFASLAYAIQLSLAT